MNKKLSGVLGIILSCLMLIFFETYFYKILGSVGVNIYKYSYNTRVIIDVLVKIFMCFIVYLIYKKDFRHNRRNDNFFKNLLMFLVALVLVIGIMYLFSYVVDYLGKIFKIDIIDRSFYNIFDKRIDFYLIVKIVLDYIVKPYLYCSIIFLGIDKITRRNDTFIILSGILASVIYAISLSGTLGYVIINSLSTFMLFITLAYFYKKQNSIWFSIVLYSSYLIGSSIIINYLGW